MLTTPCNPREEKEKLYGALAHFHREWQHGLSFAKIFDLCKAAERAEE